MASRSLFWRLGRFTATPGRDPREDRLTEILAATLERTPSFAQHLMAAWAGLLGVHGPVEVTTQRYVAGAGRIDLELSSGRSVLWLECKVDAPLDCGQVERYRDALAREGRTGVVSWLVPAWRAEEPPAEVRLNTWQDLADELHGWLDGEVDGDAPGRMLAVELLRYLEEERLAGVAGLTTADFAALGGYALAEQRLTHLVRAVSDEIATTRGRLPDAAVRQNKLGGAVNFWEHLLPAESSGWPRPADGSVNLEWNGRLDMWRARPAGAWVFGAGASFEVAKVRPPEEWLRELGRAGFEYGVHVGWGIVSRYFDADEIGFERFGTQVRELALRVEHAVGYLEAHPPPGI